MGHEEQKKDEEQKKNEVVEELHKIEHKIEYVMGEVGYACFEKAKSYEAAVEQVAARLKDHIVKFL